MTPKTLSNWRGRGKGPSYVRVGQRGIFYRIEDLDAWLSSQVVGGAA
ncbi:helix-turn-helix transcriptional regulator [Corynebacterium glyciniphilum]